jgi:hypothetical protein
MRSGTSVQLIAGRPHSRAGGDQRGVRDGGTLQVGR